MERKFTTEEIALREKIEGMRLQLDGTWICDDSAWAAWDKSHDASSRWEIVGTKCNRLMGER